MPDRDDNRPNAHLQTVRLGLLMTVAIGGAVAIGLAAFSSTRSLSIPVSQPLAAQPRPDADRPDAPGLEGGVAWINTAGPVKLADLKGKVVLLDFWTLCCINCIHVMPDLAALEKKYPDQLVVIGVHSAKFDNEKDTQSIRKAVLRYELAHPVVNDANHAIWNRYGIRSWPTLVLIDPEGKVVGSASGEGNLDVLDKAIAAEIERAKARKTLDERPIRFDLVRFREQGDTPLFFPGKILADQPGNRLFIADSTHHRIVITDLSGKKIAIAGNGSPGYRDGPFAEAQFDDPQGMALDGDTLYVADRKNHLIRALDLNAGTVSTTAGTGKQDQSTRTMARPGLARRTGLNSPWDLLLLGRSLYIAMAGHHQIWVMELDRQEIGPFAGNGREHIGDGTRATSSFAQPSGLATDGEKLYVADSEGSAIRAIPFDTAGKVTTLVGAPDTRGSLFEFGDVDGGPDKARLQHALGVAYDAGKLYVADTYNSKIKVIDLATRQTTTLIGGVPGDLPFDEPAGISIADGKLYVADTNANRVRVVDLATKAVTTLELQGVEPPPPQKEWQPPEAGKK